MASRRSRRNRRAPRASHRSSRQLASKHSARVASRSSAASIADRRDRGRGRDRGLEQRWQQYPRRHDDLNRPCRPAPTSRRSSLRSTRSARASPRADHTRQSQGQGHDGVLRRPRVPDLQGIHPGRLPAVRPGAGPTGHRQGRLPLVVHRHLRQQDERRPTTWPTSTGSRSRHTPPGPRASSGSTPSSSTTSRETRARLCERRVPDRVANQVTGLSIPTWQTDRNDPALQDQVTADNTYAQGQRCRARPH